MRKRLFSILVVIAFALCGCGNSYSDSDIEAARQQGYDKGYSDGYNRGMKDHREESEYQHEETIEDLLDELLIDGRSIRDVEEQVYREYGLTPSQAFGIVDEYEYDSTHGGFTWSEYQNAIDAIYYTASIFPYDY